MPKVSSNVGNRTRYNIVSGKTITPSDTVDLPDGVTESIWVGTAGDVTVLLVDDVTAVPYKNVSDGTRLAVAAKRVLSTGTTATNMLAEY